MVKKKRSNNLDLACMNCPEYIEIDQSRFSDTNEFQQTYECCPACGTLNFIAKFMPINYKHCMFADCGGDTRISGFCNLRGNSRKKSLEDRRCHPDNCFITFTTSLSPIEEDSLNND